MIKTAILGAGVAGLAAAHRLGASNHPATVFESADRAGGLLAPIKIRGFTFDTAVHLSFAFEPEVRAVFDTVPFFTHKPEALCWDQNTWLKHPAQNNTFPLTVAEKADLIAGLAASETGPIQNYHDWLVQQYGQPIAARWPLAYTEKYWTIPASRLGTSWIGQRMRKADLIEVVAGALTAETPNHYYVKEMRYPETGGYGSFLKPLIDAANVKYSHEAVAIHPRDGTIVFADGSDVAYENLISTLPLPQLIEMMPEVPQAVRTDAASLFATSIDLISIGFKRPRVSPALWFYIYDKAIFAARAYSPDWKAPRNVPPGCSALQFEIYSSRERGRPASIDGLKENTIQALLTMGLAERDDIIFVEHSHVPYANVVFDLGMEERRDRVRDWLGTQGIELAGRFGEWDYLWSNQSFMSGVNAADRVKASDADNKVVAR